jgi:hypothetical protein
MIESCLKCGLFMIIMRRFWKMTYFTFFSFKTGAVALQGHETDSACEDMEDNLDGDSGIFEPDPLIPQSVIDIADGALSKLPPRYLKKSKIITVHRVDFRGGRRAGGILKCIFINLAKPFITVCTDPFYGQTSGPRPPKFSQADPKLDVKSRLPIFFFFFF